MLKRWPTKVRSGSINGPGTPSAVDLAALSPAESGIGDKRNLTRQHERLKIFARYVSIHSVN